MQRRAAAVYFVLFVLIGAGAYGFMQVGMSAPEVDLDGPTYTEGDTLTVSDTEYTVTTVESESGEGGTTYTGEVTFFNESAIETATIENGSTTQFGGDTYVVQIPNQSDVSEFMLVEQLDASDIVADDPDASAVVTDEDGQRFVRFEDGSTVPVEEYLPEPQSVSFGIGDSFFYPEEDVSTVVDSVSTSGATVRWDAPGNESTDFGEGENVTLAGETYFAHFPDNSSVQILPANEYYGEYTSTLSDIDYFHERQNGMWGMVIISFLSAIVLVSAAYLPNK